MGADMVLLADDATWTWVALGAFAVVFVIVPLYFLPSIIAYARGHKNLTALFCLNLFLGWVLVGWVVSLVWAILVDQERERRRRWRYVEDDDEE